MRLRMFTLNGLHELLPSKQMRGVYFMSFGHLISSLTLILDEKFQQIYFQLNSGVHEHSIYISDGNPTGDNNGNNQPGNKSTQKIVADVESFAIFPCFIARHTPQHHTLTFYASVTLLDPSHSNNFNNFRRVKKRAMLLESKVRFEKL